MCSSDLALSPKSRAAVDSMHKAMDLVNNQPLDVLDYLKFTPVNAKEEDKYPYDRPDLWERIQYLPELVKNLQIYDPSFTSQYEQALNQNYTRLKKINRTRDLASLKSKKKV